MLTAFDRLVCPPGSGLLCRRVPVLGKDDPIGFPVGFVWIRIRDFAGVQHSQGPAGQGDREDIGIGLRELLMSTCVPRSEKTSKGTPRNYRDHPLALVTPYGITDR